MKLIKLSFVLLFALLLSCQVESQTTEESAVAEEATTKDSGENDEETVTDESIEATTEVEEVTTEEENVEEEVTTGDSAEEATVDNTEASTDSGEEATETEGTESEEETTEAATESEEETTEEDTTESEEETTEEDTTESEEVTTEFVAKDGKCECLAGISGSIFIGKSLKEIHLDDEELSVKCDSRANEQCKKLCLKELKSRKHGMKLKKKLGRVICALLRVTFKKRVDIWSKVTCELPDEPIPITTTSNTGYSLQGKLTCKDGNLAIKSSEEDTDEDTNESKESKEDDDDDDD